MTSYNVHYWLNGRRFDHNHANKFAALQQYANLRASAARGWPLTRIAVTQVSVVTITDTHLEQPAFAR